MTKPSRRSIFWCLVGGAAFWLPVIVLYTIFRDRVNVVALNLTPLAGLVVLDIARRLLHKDAPHWRWVLAGIYVLGPAAMEIAAVTAGFTSTINVPKEWLWLTIFALLPPVTLWFATLNGMIISVLLTTLLLMFLAGSQKLPGSDRVD